MVQVVRVKRPLFNSDSPSCEVKRPLFNSDGPSCEVKRPLFNSVGRCGSVYARVGGVIVRLAGSVEGMSGVNALTPSLPANILARYQFSDLCIIKSSFS